MRPISILAAIGLCVPVFSQSGRIQNGRAFKNNVGFAYETRLEPPTPIITGDKLGGGGVNVGETGIHRFMADSSRHVFFGYDITIDRLTEETAYRMTIRPLSIGADKLRYFSDPANWTMLPLPGYPVPQIVHYGDVIALDLMTNGDTGQKIVDYLTIQEPPRGEGTFNPDPPRWFSYVAGAPRDFTVDDASLRLTAPRLTINGKLDESSTRVNGEVTGAAAWIYVPNRGRFILSLAPNQALGFRKTGEVRGSSLTFTVGSETFVVDTASRIAPGEVPFNLYVLQDRAWKPSYAHADLSAFTMGAADRAEWLVKR